MVLGDSGEEAQDQQKQHNSLIDSSAITMSSRTNHWLSNKFNEVSDIYGNNCCYDTKIIQRTRQTPENKRPRIAVSYSINKRIVYLGIIW